MSVCLYVIFCNQHDWNYPTTHINFSLWKVLNFWVHQVIYLLFILATLISLHYNIYKMQWNKLPQLVEMAEISADEYIMCVG